MSGDVITPVWPGSPSGSTPSLTPLQSNFQTLDNLSQNGREKNYLLLATLRCLSSNSCSSSRDPQLIIGSESRNAARSGVSNRFPSKASYFLKNKNGCQLLKLCNIYFLSYLVLKHLLNYKRLTL